MSKGRRCKFFVEPYISMGSYSTNAHFCYFSVLSHFLFYLYIYIYIFKWLSLCLGVKLVLTAKPVFAYNRNYVANFRLKDIAVLLDTVRTVGVGYEEVPCILVSSEGIYTARVDNVYSISLKILRKCIHTDTLQLEYSRV